MQVTLVTPEESEQTGVSNYTNELFGILKHKIDITKKFFPRLRVSLPFFDFKMIFKNYPLFFPRISSGIIHIPNYFYAFPLLWKKPGRIVLTVHDLIPSVYPFESVFPHILYNVSLRAARKADRIIVDSQNTKQDVLKFLRYPANKIDIVHLGVNTKKFKSLKKVKKVPCSILYVGTEMPRKNLAVLIRAFAKLKQKLPQSKLIKVGKPHWPGARCKLVNLAKELNISASIEFKDYIDDIVQEYNQAELFVFPSLYEGFGLPILEAMACKMPVICSNKTSLPEVGGDAVIYFDGYDEDDLAKKMFKVLTDKTLRKRLILKGLQRAKMFSWEKTAEKTLQVYKKLL